MNAAAKALIFKPVFGKRRGEIIAKDITTMKGRMYMNSILRKDNTMMKIVLADAGRPTKNFSSFIM
jgi:hypothetical protein